MERIEEIFTPTSIKTLDEFFSFVIGEVKRRGGDPATIEVIDTETAIPNVQFSEEWPCLTIEFKQAVSEA